MSPPGVTVAVPVRNRREQMARCLEALLAQDHPSYEVLVLDNLSTDGTGDACLELARSSPVPVRVERLAGAVGRLRNAAATLGRGEVLVFTDSDCVPRPNWLRMVTAPFAGDAGLGVVQGVTRPDPVATRTPWDVTQDLASWTGRYECCNLAVRRAALAGSDGFDEKVFFGEDLAGGHAIERAGWRSRFAPDAIVEHDVTSPGFAWWLRRALMYGNLARILRRYPELRRELLWGRVFLRPRSAKLLAALLGVALTGRRPPALVLVLPYLAERAPRRRNPAAFGFRLGQTVLFDMAVLAGLVRGSVRYRSLVL